MNTLLYQVRYLLLREWLCARPQFKDMIINYWVIWPLTFCYANGYFLPIALFGDSSYIKSTELVLGMVLFATIINTFMRVLTIISDRLETGVLAYHATTVSLKTVFFTRMIWVSGYIYFLMVPFVFVGKIALGPWLITDHVAWGHFFVVLLCGVLLSVSYLFCWIGLLNSIDTFEHMWERGVEPVMWFGGAWAPAYAIIQSGVPGVALISRLNPFTYFSDGIRQVFLPEVRFASLTTCYSAMLISTVLFSLVGYYLLKRRMDLIS